MSTPHRTHFLTEHVTIVLLEDIRDKRGSHDLLHIVHITLSQHAHHQRASHGQQQAHSLADILLIVPADKPYSHRIDRSIAHRHRRDIEQLLLNLRTV